MSNNNNSFWQLNQIFNFVNAHSCWLILFPVCFCCYVFDISIFSSLSFCFAVIHICVFISVFCLLKSFLIIFALNMSPVSGLEFSSLRGQGHCHFAKGTSIGLL